MEKKIDGRLPREIGGNALPSHAAVKSPWEKLVSFYDASHYTGRYASVVGSAAMQALRILEPDYKVRSEMMCKVQYDRMYALLSGPYGKNSIDNLNIHPFCKGNFVGGLFGDSGDEDLLMCGRVNDISTYRAEKELDVCDWDIVGSELCRATTQGLQALSNGHADHLEKGPQLDFHMVEAKGCGDLHCRVVAESREKYPMPEHEKWECFGPIATADQINFTPEEETVKESMIFRDECDFKYCSATCQEKNAEEMYNTIAIGGPAGLVLRTIDALIKNGNVDEKFADHVIQCVCEAAGKAAFGEFYAKEGLRNWLGVPAGINDGRVMEGHIEVVLQCLRVPYEIEAFNKEEVVYLIDRAKLSNNLPKLADVYLGIWYGMVKTLVNAQWSLWEEKDLEPEGKIRLKIAKKIDKFC